MASAAQTLTAAADYSALGQSIGREFDYAPAVSGRLPVALRGVLLRNGPGLFERAGQRKNHLLDGDGLIQAFRFDAGTVRYQARFVRTAKYLAEEAAGAWRYPTWTTRSAPGLLGNSLGRIRTQAGVAVVVKRGRAFAFDDTGLPYEVDPATLETLGEYRPGGAASLKNYNAHTRYDSTSGDWLLFGQEHGRRYRLNVVTLDRALNFKQKFTVTAPRATYIHDWFVTPNFVVFNCHALAFHPLAGLLGLKAFTECLAWQPQLGNTVIVADRRSGEVRHVSEAAPAFMWHSLNAWESGDTLTADFVGYDEPDHFIGDNPAFEAIMRGAGGSFAAPGTLRRYTINLRSGALDEETLDAGHFEFPMIDMRESAQPTTRAFLAEASQGAGWHDSVSVLDMASGAKASYRFDGPCQVGEPVFVAEPDRARGGYLLAVTFNTATQSSALAILQADNVAAGPLATVALTHAAPLSFHGTWLTA